MTDAATQVLAGPPPSEALVGSPPELKATIDEGPNWYYPWTWIPLDGWTNSAELGINGNSGNANSFSIQAGTRFQTQDGDQSV